MVIQLKLSKIFMLIKYMYKLHAINFPKSKFTYHEAIKYYTEKFNEKRDHYTNLPHFWRFTTIYTKEWLKKNGYNNYITKILPNGIELIITYK